jgi:hypothetical protein
MGSVKTSLFPLPDTQVVETVYVRLDDGRIVPRSPEEVLALQQSSAPPLAVIPSKT